DDGDGTYADDVDASHVGRGVVADDVVLNEGGLSGSDLNSSDAECLCIVGNCVADDLDMGVWADGHRALDNDSCAALLTKGIVRSGTAVLVKRAGDVSQQKI